VPLTDDELRAIGRISVNFNALENVISAVVWTFVGPDPMLGVLLTAGESFDRLLSKFKQLAHYRLSEPQHLDLISGWLPKVRSVQQQRNRILHSAWLEPKDRSTGIVAYKITVRGIDMDHNLHPYSARELDEIADHIDAVRQEFTTIIETIFDSLKSRA
jgi:hypothetical protein